MSGENSNAHKDQQDGPGENMHHVLEETGDNNGIQEWENECSVPDWPGGNDDTTSKDAQEGDREYHVLEGPDGDSYSDTNEEENHEYHVLEGSSGEQKSDTNKGIQNHEYHVLEGPGNSSRDANAGIQMGDHEYHVLEGMTPELEGSEEGEKRE
jgi:hypothetical protein